MEVLKVSAQSKPKSVAGALAAVLRENGVAELQAVGAGAVNQAVKAIAIARALLRQTELTLLPSRLLQKSISMARKEQL